MTVDTAPVGHVLDADRPVDGQPVAADQPAAHDAIPRYRALAGRALRWSLLALAAAMLVRFMSHGWPEIRASLSLLTVQRMPLFALAVVAETLWVYAMSQVYRSALMAFGGRVRRLTAVRISMAAFTLSRVLPGGGAAGGAVAARELIALGNPAVETILSMLASWWITMTGLAALSVAGIAASVFTDVLPAHHLIVPGIALAIFVGGGVALTLVARSPRSSRRLADVIARAAARFGPQVAASVVDASVGSATRRVRRGGLFAVFGWGMVVWITDATALWLALAAFGWQVEVGVLLVAYGVANMISALPELTPGWLGVLEASVAVTLSTFGVPNGVAVIAVLAYRLVSYWLPTAAGIPAAASVFGGRPLTRWRARRPGHALG
ncbi:MAG TPA: YbhN family protein [Euzebyales bacterium]